MAVPNPRGQHWTFGHARRQGFVGAPASAGGLPLVPLTLCGLLLTLFAIAATIVLSLIPVYLNPRKPNVNCASDPISSTFNIDGGPLPSGQLTPNNQAALQTGLNGYLVTQKEFSRCALQLTNGNVGNCTSTRRLLLNTRKRRQESSLFRHVRQTNDNCVSQQIATTSVLNCGCSCVGVCLRQRVDQLNLLLRTIRIPITFPDRTTTSVIIVGVGIFIPSPTSITSTSSITSTNTASTNSTSTSVTAALIG